MINTLTFCVNTVAKKEKMNGFGKWFKPIVEATDLKKKAIAEKAGIDPVSFSRILNGEHGTAKQTAIDLINAVNELAVRQVADMETGLRLIAGIEPPDDEIAGIFRDLNNLPPERKRIAKQQMKAIVDAMKEKPDFDFDYIED